MKRHFLIKIFLVLLILTNVNLKTIAQPDTIRKTTQSSFYLFYNVINNSLSIAGVFPAFQLSGTRFIYTQNSYLGEKKEIDTVCFGAFRQTSVDSINEIVKDFKDTTISKINPCLISGDIRYLTIANGSGTTKFELTNTFDYRALKIIDIVNEYLPMEKRLRVSEKLIKAEEDCWDKMMKSVNKDKRIILKKPKNKNAA